MVNLAPEVWVVIGLIVAMAVVACLGIAASVLEYELGVVELRRQVREMKRPLETWGEL